MGNHSAEECSKYNKNHYKDKSNNLMIRKNADTFIFIPSKINSRDANILIDTSSVSNMMSLKQSQHFCRSLQPLEKKVQLLVANGQYTQVTQKADTQISFDGGKSDITITFYVVDEFVDDVILGLKFLQQHDAKLLLKNRSLEIADQSIIFSDKIDNDNPDFDLADKICLSKL
ncbi:putative transposable element [Pseudoloma neurophilia]|uniref:Putative transposable element n=1 Tax=Pseudoloma neurophilia TaxID=146866 RepID=A0A0R0M1K0_9MICR|nr:putative transposable element [Pseudoloma neurophilia]